MVYDEMDWYQPAKSKTPKRDFVNRYWTIGVLILWVLFCLFVAAVKYQIIIINIK